MTRCEDGPDGATHRVDEEFSCGPILMDDPEHHGPRRPTVHRQGFSSCMKRSRGRDSRQSNSVWHGSGFLWGWFLAALITRATVLRIIPPDLSMGWNLIHDKKTVSCACGWRDSELGALSFRTVSDRNSSEATLVNTGERQRGTGTPPDTGSAKVSYCGANQVTADPKRPSAQESFFDPQGYET